MSTWVIGYGIAAFVSFLILCALVVWDRTNTRVLKGIGGAGLKVAIVALSVAWPLWLIGMAYFGVRDLWKSATS